MTATIKPPPLRPAVDGGFTLDDFAIDEPAGTATCPAGNTVTITPARAARFGRHCATCQLRHRCTTATDGRVITLHPHHGLLAAARAQARTNDFQALYRRHRPMIERTIAWLVRAARRLPTAVSTATSSGGHTAAQPSTSSASSTSASPTTAPGRSPSRHPGPRPAEASAVIPAAAQTEPKGPDRPAT